MQAGRRMKLVIIVQVDSIRGEGWGAGLGIQKLQRHNRPLLSGEEKGYSFINSNTQGKTDRMARRGAQQKHVTSPGSSFQQTGGYGLTYFKRCLIIGSVSLRWEFGVVWSLPGPFLNVKDVK